MGEPGATVHVDQDEVGVGVLLSDGLDEGHIGRFVGRARIARAEIVGSEVDDDRLGLVERKVPQNGVGEAYG